MQPSIARSYLFVPGNRPERFSKACAAGADAVIIDLEDAVPAAEKAAAREKVALWLDAARPVLIRINAAGSQWFEDDVKLCRAPGVTGIVLPKAETADDIRFAAQCAAATKILPLIESARGFCNAQALAQSPAVQRLVFGSIDFQVDLGISGENEELLYFRSQLVLVSRLAGLQAPVDGVTTSLDDPGQIRADTLRGRRLGFGAKLCIHPRQVAHVNECFTPSPEEVAWARRVMEAATRAEGAAVAVDGRMVDRPVILKAQGILDEAQGRALKQEAMR